MTQMRKSRVIACILGVSAMSLAACSAPYGHNSYSKTNHFAGHSVNGQGYYRGPVPRHNRANHSNRQTFPWSKPANARTPMMPQFQQWVDYEPQYRLYPGDQVDIVVSSAPELSRTLTVGPDGRIVMPMTQPVMAAGHTFTQLEQALSAQLSKQLRDPRIAVSPRAYAPAQIFVGGEVGAQGTYTLPGPVGAMEAILMAGGLNASARPSQIAVLRRAPNGGMMMRTVNISGGMRNMAQYNDVMQLRRGDIVFVPKTHLAEIGVWVQAFRAALPIDFNLSYQFGSNGGNGTTVITP